jgi:hypothetical protein
MSANSRFLTEKMRILRYELPTAFPIRLRVADLPDGRMGDCSLMGHKGKKLYLLVRIQADLPQVSALLILWHEYAHALSWTFEHQALDDHGAEWGIALSRTWLILERLE